MEETTKKLLSTTDAKVWADEFCKMYPSMDNDVMLVRFANAIELWRSTQQSFIIKNRTIEELERKKKLYKDVWLMD